MTKEKNFSWTDFIGKKNAKKDNPIKEFIIYKIPDENRYIIRKSDNTKEESFEMLNLIQEILDTTTDLSPKQIVDYCKNQRYFMKLYCKKILEEESSKK